MSGLTLITPTGGRPEAFALCERWMERQTYNGEIQWIVIDDCDPPTVCRMGQSVFRPELKWQPGQNTLARNLRAAVTLGIRMDRIVVIEDDDYYGARYLQTMSLALDCYPLVGEARARYYNIETRQYWLGPKAPSHASLCQTAFRADLLPDLLQWCDSAETGIDQKFWRHCRAPKLFLNEPQSVGIKGMPGRPGIGMGHRPRSNWPTDGDGAVLRSWLGKDASAYQGFSHSAAA